MHELVPASGRDSNPKPIRHAPLANHNTMTMACNLGFPTRDVPQGIQSATAISRGATQIAIHPAKMSRPNTIYHIQRFHQSLLKTSQTR